MSNDRKTTTQWTTFHDGVNLSVRMNQFVNDRLGLQPFRGFQQKPQLKGLALACHTESCGAVSVDCMCSCLASVFFPPSVWIENIQFIQTLLFADSYHAWDLLTRVEILQTSVGPPDNHREVWSLKSFTVWWRLMFSRKPALTHATVSSNSPRHVRPFKTCRNILFLEKMVSGWRSDCFLGCVELICAYSRPSLSSPIGVFAYREGSLVCLIRKPQDCLSS